MFTMESYVECPDYHVSDGTFSKPRRITDANPQQDEYLWGRMVLIDYRNKDGERLQGALAIPDSRKRDERMPMVVGFYEKSSQYLNEYERPAYASSSWHHLMDMVSGGYMMMYADIHFRVGSTMEDMLECVEAAGSRGSPTPAGTRTNAQEPRSDQARHRDASERRSPGQPQWLRRRRPGHQCSPRVSRIPETAKPVGKQ